MKKNLFRLLSAGFVFCGFLALSLACASSPQEPVQEPKTTITLADVNQAVKNQEVSILANNGLDSDQLMEVTKLCIQTGELNNVTIVEENAKLSFAVLEVKVTLNKSPVAVKFSYSISKSGSLKMRITEVRELDPTNAPYSLTVYSKDFDSNIESIKNLILESVKKVGNTVVARSADFA